MKQLTERERGLEVVEFLIITGLIMVVALIIFQFMIFGHTQMVTASAAREGARAASVCENVGSAVSRSRQSYSYSWDYSPLGLRCLIGGQPVTVRVQLNLPIVLSGIWGTYNLPPIRTRSVGIAMCEDVDAIPKFNNMPPIWAPMLATCF